VKPFGSWLCRCARARDRALDFWRSERDMLSARMRTSECDVLHAHWTYEFALSALVSGLPTLVTSHDWAPAVWQQHRDAYRTIRALMQLRVLRTAGALTAVSPYIQSRMARYAKAEVRLIPNGIHRLDRHEEIPNATGRIGAVNVGFDRKKNVGSLLRAFAHVRSINPAAELHLVGPEYETGGAANRWAAAEALAEGVTFQGPLPYDETLDFIRSVNLLVHPSLEESFGMVVLEAAASGTPVIAHTGALGPAWILEGAPECLVDCRSIQKLAAAISAGLAGEMNPSMPEHLRANVLSRFSIEASATQYLEALASLATGN
jgi:glycosyltransferase involved in cell wall biosynthesis